MNENLSQEKQISLEFMKAILQSGKTEDYKQAFQMAVDAKNVFLDGWEDLEEKRREEEKQDELLRASFVNGRSRGGCLCPKCRDLPEYRFNTPLKDGMI